MLYISLHIARLLHAAAKTKDAELLEIIAEGTSHSYVNDGGLPARMPPLLESCFAANIDAVRVLLQHGANLNISYRGQLYMQRFKLAMKQLRAYSSTRARMFHLVISME